MRNRKGFTLIELLVVIAIIGLLLAIIAPALRKAKEAAWNVICRNNLKSYGIAGTMYVEESNKLFPNAWGSIYRSLDMPNHPRACQFHCAYRNPVSMPQLAGSLWPYLGSQDKSHNCPVFDRFSKQFHTGCADIDPVDTIFAYSMNAMLGGFELSGGSGGTAIYSHVMQVRTSDVRSPATIFFFGEENPWINSARYGATLNDNALCGSPQHPSVAAAWSTPIASLVTRDASGGTTSGAKYLDCLASFHKTTFEKKEDGESNVVFIDGHVDLASWENTYRMARWTETMPPRK